ncbi:MAG: hypothetical protein AB1714_20545 [Acidobacteriota bacterium]
MRRIKSVLGYAWAALALPMVLATFIGMDSWARGFASITGLQVSPWFTGAEVVRTLDHGEYETRIHRPVFDGLISERGRGFVQVVWVPKGDTLPAMIDEDLDIIGDDRADCRISLDTRTNQISLTPLCENVLGVKEKLVFEKDRGLRILVSNPRR